MYKLSDYARTTFGRDGAVVLHIQQGQVFKLNAVGARILALLHEGRDEQEIIDSLHAEFPDGGDSIRGDVHEFVHLLKCAHVVEGDPTGKGEQA